ncbi:MAG: germination protein YpeB [Clostridia bacterium]|nr:germination protein YpeB [Clostridia bacterium]
MKKYLAITIAAGLLFVLAGVMIFQSRQLTALKNTVAELRLGALRQSAEALDNLSLTLEKALLTSDAAHAAELMHAIGQSAELTRQNLSLLPASPALQPALVFTGRLSDYASSLLGQLTGNQPLTARERVLLRQHLALCAQLAAQLTLADSPDDLNRLTLDLPESTARPQPKGLPEGEVTQQEAIDIARTFVGAHRVTGAMAAPGTSGALPAYGVTVRTQDVQLNLEITRQGGKVLWMMPETASFSVTQSPQSCQEAALAFLELHDFSPMQAVHRQIYDGLCVISLVPTQDNVLLYPDLIRVQVRMDTAEVVGLEAHNYWLNHIIRALPEPALTQEDVQARLQHTAESMQLCVIPLDGQETLCYECTVPYEGETFLVYINATTGQEADVMKVITVETGTLTA